ncbi:hypothetical protein V494_06716 [Pseudogymnoascus sp. VKM F-4513 (FW-928)]|nr:hypothetical protein V494_06716 [Pseudogymnoascus sp. VKM F-4513 (FW-928)]
MSPLSQSHVAGREMMAVVGLRLHMYPLLANIPKYPLPKQKEEEEQEEEDRKHPFSLSSFLPSVTHSLNNSSGNLSRSQNRVGSSESTIIVIATFHDTLHKPSKTKTKKKHHPSRRAATVGETLTCLSPANASKHDRYFSPCAHVS